VIRQLLRDLIRRSRISVVDPSRILIWPWCASNAAHPSGVGSHWLARSAPTGGAASFVITPVAFQDTASGDNRRCGLTAATVQVPGCTASSVAPPAGIVCRASGGLPKLLYRSPSGASQFPSDSFSTNCATPMSRPSASTSNRSQIASYVRQCMPLGFGGHSESKPL